jgi:hypothetical protein
MHLSKLFVISVEGFLFTVSIGLLGYNLVKVLRSVDQ